MNVCPNCHYRGGERVCPRDGFPMVSAAHFGRGAQEPELIGKVFDNRYEVEALLGTGGMGWVFKARHIVMGHHVALKVLRQGLAEDLTAVRRFYNEARACSQLSQPHTIRVYDFGATEDGYLYLAMEFLEGHPLKDEMIACGPMPPARAIHIARQICDSLDEAHEKGMVHRDLKPDNVFLCEYHNARDFVKVLDFGIAKWIQGDGRDEAMTKAGLVMGTPKYMSPEQAKALPLDRRSDVYSLGIILYEMLAGQVPFDSDSTAALLVKHLNDPVPPIVKFSAGQPVPDHLRRVILSMLQKDRDRRPPTATIVERELAKIAATLPDPNSLPDPVRRSVPARRGATGRSGAVGEVNEAATLAVESMAAVEARRAAAAAPAAAAPPAAAALAPPPLPPAPAAARPASAGPALQPPPLPPARGSRPVAASPAVARPATPSAVPAAPPPAPAPLPAPAAPVAAAVPNDEAAVLAERRERAQRLFDARRQRDRRMLLALMGAFGVVLVAIIVLVLSLRGRGRGDVPEIPPPAGARPVVAAAAADAAGADAAAADAAAADAAGADAAAAASGTADAGAAGPAGAPDTAPAASGGDASAGPAPAAADVAAAPPAAPDGGAAVAGTAPEVAAPPAPAPVPVLVRSAPAGAMVVDGATRLGLTPLEVKVLPGQSRRVALQLKGYVTAERTLSLVGGATLDVTLEPEPRPAPVPKPVAKAVEAKPATQPAAKPATKPAGKPAATAAGAKPEAKPEAKPKAPPAAPKPKVKKPKVDVNFI